MAESLSSDLVPTVHSRAALLERLDSEELDRRKLHRNVADSRSTVYRALAELEAHHLADQENGRYQATRFGRLVHQEYRRFIAVIDALCTLNNSIETFPPAAHFDPIVLVDATIVPATKTAPAAPFVELKSLFAGAERVQCLSPVWSRSILGIIDAYLADDTAITLLTNRAHSRPALDEILTHDHCTQRVVGAPPPFLLALAERPDPTVGVVLFDDIGRPDAIIRTGAQAAVDWADAVIDDCLHDH